MLNEQRGEGRTLHIHTPEKSSEPSLKSGRRIVRKPEFNKYVPQHKKKLDSSLGHNTSLNRGSFKLEPARKYIKRLATEVESLTPLSSTEEGFQVSDDKFLLPKVESQTPLRSEFISEKKLRKICVTNGPKLQDKDFKPKFVRQPTNSITARSKENKQRPIKNTCEISQSNSGTGNGSKEVCHEENSSNKESKKIARQKQRHSSATFEPNDDNYGQHKGYLPETKGYVGVKIEYITSMLEGLESLSVSAKTSRKSRIEGSRCQQCEEKQLIIEQQAEMIESVQKANKEQCKQFLAHCRAIENELNAQLAKNQQLLARNRLLEEKMAQQQESCMSLQQILRTILEEQKSKNDKLRYMSIQNSALLKIKIMGEQALQDLEVLREENIYYKNKINSYVNKLGIYGIQKRMVELDRPVSKSVLEAHPEKQKLSLKSKPSKARTHSYERQKDSDSSLDISEEQCLEYDTQIINNRARLLP